MQEIRALLVLMLLLSPFDAQASFFFFLFPTGGKASPGELCVAASTKVGDVKTNANGSSLTIKKLSGTSSRCQKDGLPMLALGEYAASTTFSPKAGVDLPNGYEPEPLTDYQKYTGILLVAKNKSTNASLRVSAVKSELVSDLDTYAGNLKKYFAGQMDDAKSSDIETTVVNRLPARRYSIDGKVRNLFGTRVTYLLTILQGADEVVLVDAWAPSAKYQQLQPELRHIAESVVGVKPPSTVPPRAGSQSAAAAAAPDGNAVSAVPVALASPAGTQESDKSAAKGGADSPAGASSDSPEQRLRRLSELLKEGLISQQEYDAKKAEILKAM
jgi:hypothetical protein